MRLKRRDFIKVSGAGALAGLVNFETGTQPHPGRKIKAIAFDAFPIFDPRSIFALTEELFPGKGTELNNRWRMRQFEYTWLRSLSNNYEDFWKVTESALTFAARALKLELTAEKRDRLMESYLKIQAYQDVLPALKTLKERGVKLGFLSNFTSSMLAAGIKNSGLESYFEQVLSTDRVKTYKPSPRAYQMGIDAFCLKKEEIVFAAFAGWDAAGAKWFGYDVFWVNRFNAPREELGVQSDGEGTSLNELVDFVQKY